MQLESTLFGVCVIQIKPQLERVLNLPADCLTKEFELTQRLFSLFIKYRISSDLLSYDGNIENSNDVKVKVVQDHVRRIDEMIGKMKEKILTEETDKQIYREAKDSHMDPFVYDSTSLPDWDMTPDLCEYDSFSSLPPPEETPKPLPSVVQVTPFFSFLRNSFLSV